jgi:flagellar biosynthesis/type III secretory pathway M-ring protein FliF/YscJ
MTIRNALRATKPVRNIDRSPPFHSQEPHLPRPHAAARSRETVHSQGSSAGSDHPSGEKSAAAGGLREELSELVRVHPDSAASLLRTWIGNSG